MLANIYQREGFCVLPYKLSSEKLEKVRRSVERISRQVRPEVVYENTSGESVAVRAIHGCHRYDDVCAKLVREPELINAAEELLGSAVYVHQFKVNLKVSRIGAEWPWHQDFSFWHREDGMPKPSAVNVAILLDPVHATNGPLQFIPRTHGLGLLDGGTEGLVDESGGWKQDVSADLTYTVPKETAESLRQDRGIFSFEGEVGTTMAFHPCLVHSSAANLSGDRRALLLITYNSIHNVSNLSSRPEFLADRDSTPLRADVWI